MKHHAILLHEGEEVLCHVEFYDPSTSRNNGQKKALYRAIADYAFIYAQTDDDICPQEAFESICEDIKMSNIITVTWSEDNGKCFI